MDGNHSDMQKDRHLYLLSEIADIVSSALSDKYIYEGILWEISNGLGLDALWIQIYNSTTNQLLLNAHRGLPDKLVRELEVVQMGDGVAGKIAQGRKPVFSNDINRDRSYQWDTAAKLGFNSLIASPVISGGRLLGLIGGLSYKNVLFTLNELKLVNVIAACISEVCNRIIQDRISPENKRQKEDVVQKQFFLNALSHELKTPLTAIIASTGLLIEELEQRKDERLLKIAQNISRGAASLQNRLGELLSVSKTRNESFNVNMQELDFSKLAKEVIGEISSLAKQRNQILYVDIPDGIKIIGDAQRMEQIMLNLLSNAIKYSPEGGKIEFIARKDDNRLVVSVKDSGPGILEEERQKLFKPYYHLSADRTADPRSGLGLTITRQLVELHGGSIWVQSEIGKGSTFYFSLPLTAAYPLPMNNL